MTSSGQNSWKKLAFVQNKRRNAADKEREGRHMAVVSVLCDKYTEAVQAINKS